MRNIDEQSTRTHGIQQSRADHLAQDTDGKIGTHTGRYGGGHAETGVHQQEDPTRSLRDEFMIVFTKETEIMADLA